MTAIDEEITIGAEFIGEHATHSFELHDSEATGSFSVAIEGNIDFFAMKTSSPSKSSTSVPIFLPTKTWPWLWVSGIKTPNWEGKLGGGVSEDKQPFKAMNRRFQQAFTALKEHTCVNYAKLVTAGGLANVHLILVKATPPNDLPLPDKYLRSSFWEDPKLASRLEMLTPPSPVASFDVSSSNPESFTMFIRSYAHLLDEISTESSPDDCTEETGRALEVLRRIQSLIDRVIDCRPTGVAARSFLIQTAMKHIIRDSFVCYTVFRKDIVLVLENLFQMPYRSCISAFGIYKKAALQGNQLWEFYQWCKLMGVCGSYEYPFVDRIPLIQIQALESFIKGMWEMADEDDHQSSSPSSSTAEKVDEDEREEREPLIQLDDDDDDESENWEDILEASIDGLNEHSHGCAVEDEWMIKVYNPFDHAKYVCSDPEYPWGL
ncbi:hypothetical protein GQ457_06G000370 [Hibiscus cannabinus]